jgi:hypothetical protein
MKTVLKISTAVILSAFLGGGALLSACAAPKMTETAKAQDTSPLKTVKPGAAVTFAHSSPKNLLPGQYGKITISVTDDYDAGTLYLKAVPDEGLRLVSETAETDFSMSGKRTHEWELDVSSATKGVYYVNVFATVKLTDGTEFLRSYAAQILVGDVTEADIQNAMKSNGTLSKDGKTISMEAEETIQ